MTRAFYCGVAHIRAGAYPQQPLSATFNASLEDDTAVLRFPYDERLRQLLRAIPGRRWDAERRVWRVPVDPDRAEALSRLLATVPTDMEVSDGLSRALERRRARRRSQECLLDLARPDESWWFSFATDNARDLVEELLAHPDAHRLAAIGRAVIPLDKQAAELVSAVLARTPRLRLTEDASHALVEITQPKQAKQREAPPAWDVALRRGRGGGAWIVIAPEHAPLARALAAASGLAVLDGDGSSVALAAVDGDATRIAALLTGLDAFSVDPRVQGWLQRATTWHGTIDVDGPTDAPVFVLIGKAERLPPSLRESAREFPGGVSLPLTLESWGAIDAQRLSGWTSDAAKRCIAALVAGAPAPAAVLEMSTVHDEPSFVLAPGHDALRVTPSWPSVPAGRV